MPFRRLGMRRRRFMRRRPFFRRRFSRFARRRPTVPRRTRLRPEVKKNNLSLTIAALSSGGTVTHICEDLDQGVQDNERVGRRVRMRYYNMRARITNQLNSGLLESQPLIRVMIFRDLRTASATEPLVTDVLQDASVFASLDSTNSGRFKVYFDRVFNLSKPAPSNTVTTDPIKIFFTHFKRLNYEAEFSGALGSTQSKNGLYLLALTDTDTAGALDTQIRYGFTDV